jgi:ABC-type multidrug transport system fused ATPase/permease subunit
MKDIRGTGISVGMGAEKEKDDESREKVRIEALKKRRREKTYFILVSVFLTIILFYTLYIGELLWGIVIDILILRLYFLMKRERSYLKECDRNEEEAGTTHDPEMKRRIWIANMLITLFVLGLVIYSYFTFQFIWGVVAGLLILLYVHMLLFSEDNL